jgi:hypothetical protein
VFVFEVCFGPKVADDIDARCCKAFAGLDDRHSVECLLLAMNGESDHGRQPGLLHHVERDLGLAKPVDGFGN